jgi:NAD(P)-dependent dehydrogenase (short-subunit alcohol dehydrogenase family)
LFADDPVSGRRAVTGAALVTGAGRRVGAAIATYLARRGYRVFLHVNRSRDEALALAQNLRAEGAQADVIACDLTDLDAVFAMTKAVLDTGAQHYLVVNNASWFGHDLPGAASLTNLDASLNVHVRAPFAIMEAMATGRKGARLDIVNVLDQKLGAPNPDYYSYTIGKHALWGASRTWRTAQVDGVRVFGLWPGLLLTSDDLDETAYKARRAANPLGRAIDLSDVTAAFDLVLDAPGLPGQDLIVDAGESLKARRRDVAFDV